jgi:hypothetical protein
MMVRNERERTMAKKSRAQRLTEAVQTIQQNLEKIGDIKLELEEWRDGMPENIQDANGATMEKLETAIDLMDGGMDSVHAELEEIENIEMPLGFGRD